MEQRQKTRKSINFTRAEWKPIAAWIKAQRPRISEAEGLRRLVWSGYGWRDRGVGFPPEEALVKTKQPTRKRAEP